MDAFEPSGYSVSTSTSSASEASIDEASVTPSERTIDARHAEDRAHPLDEGGERVAALEHRTGNVRKCLGLGRSADGGPRSPGRLVHHDADEHSHHHEDDERQQVQRVGDRHREERCDEEVVEQQSRGHGARTRPARCRRRSRPPRRRAGRSAPRWSRAPPIGTARAPSVSSGSPTSARMNPAIRRLSDSAPPNDGSCAGPPRRGRRCARRCRPTPGSRSPRCPVR